VTPVTTLPRRAEPVSTHKLDHRRSEYELIADTAEFSELRRRYRDFVFPATVAFLVWYLLYVVMSMWASDFMGTKVVGNINVALVFGLLQFATTFLLAWLYSRHSTRELDPLARELTHRFDRGGDL